MSARCLRQSDRGLGRSEPQLAGTQPGAVAPGAPRVAFVSFYGPGRAVWANATASRWPSAWSEPHPIAAMLQRTIRGARWTRRRERSRHAAQRRARALPLVFGPYSKNTTSAWPEFSTLRRNQSQPVALDDTNRPLQTKRGLTCRAQALACYSIAEERRVWSINAESPTPRVFLSQRRCTALAAPQHLRADLGTHYCRWRESGGTQRPSYSDQGDHSTAKSTTGRTPRPATAFAIPICIPTVKELPAELLQLLTMRDLTKSLGVCRRTLEREIQRGRFPRPVKIGSASRWPVSDVAAYLQALQAQRTP